MLYTERKGNWFDGSHFLKLFLVVSYVSCVLRKIGKNRIYQLTHLTSTTQQREALCLHYLRICRILTSLTQNSISLEFPQIESGTKTV